MASQSLCRIKFGQPIILQDKIWPANHIEGYNQPLTLLTFYTNHYFISLLKRLNCGYENASFSRTSFFIFNAITEPAGGKSYKVKTCCDKISINLYFYINVTKTYVQSFHYLLCML